MKRRILVLVPLFTPQEDVVTIKKYLRNYAWEGTDLDVISTHENYAVNSRAEADYALPEFLDLLIKAEKDGYDAVVSYCCWDVGVEASRELVKIPVIGPFLTSIVIANMLGKKFSVLSKELPSIKGLKRVPLGCSETREFGVGIGSYVSTRHIPYEKFFVFSGDPDHVRIMKNAFIEAGEEAISDGAQVLILACTAWLFSLEELNVPVIDSSITLKVAEALIDIKKKSSPFNTKGKTVRTNERKAQAKMRIKALVPTCTGLNSRGTEYVHKILNAGTELDIVKFEEGPESIKSAHDLAKASRFVLKEARNTSKEGYDAVIICSFEDYFLDSARELCDIPVVGLGETSMLLSCLFGTKFSVVTDNKQAHSIIEKTARKSGIEHRLLSVRYADKAEKTEFLREIKNAINEGADAVIIGTVDAHEPIRSIPPDVEVPVLDPLPIALKTAEVLHTLKLSHSKVLYPMPVLPVYHRQRLEKLKESKKIKEKLEPSMFLYG